MTTNAEDIEHTTSDVDIMTVTHEQVLNTCTSPFFDKLPTELRCMIYHAVLVVEESIPVTKSEIKGRTALLKTSEQVREEANRVFYTDNAFLITIDAGAEAVGLQWLRLIDKEQRQYLRRLNFTS